MNQSLVNTHVLVALDTEEQIRQEAEQMRHALHLLYRTGRFEAGTRWFSVRTPAGERVLTCSVTPGNVCHHIVGLANRPPTSDELKITASLLAKILIFTEYCPDSTQ